MTENDVQEAKVGTYLLIYYIKTSRYEDRYKLDVPSSNFWLFFSVKVKTLADCYIVMLVSLIVFHESNLV